MTPYATSFPVISGGTVTEGHTRHCETYGHATHTVNGMDMGYCPRCGYVPVTEDDSEQEQELVTYEVQVPVRGEVIFTVNAYSESEALEKARRMDWDEGELNVDEDCDLETHFAVLD